MDSDESDDDERAPVVGAFNASERTCLGHELRELLALEREENRPAGAVRKAARAALSARHMQEVRKVDAWFARQGRTAKAKAPAAAPVPPPNPDVLIAQGRLERAYSRRTGTLPTLNSANVRADTQQTCRSLASRELFAISARELAGGLPWPAQLLETIKKDLAAAAGPQNTPYIYLLVQKIIDEEREACVSARLRTCAHRLQTAGAPLDVAGMAAQLSAMLGCPADDLQKAYGALIAAKLPAVAASDAADAAERQRTGLLLPPLSMWPAHLAHLNVQNKTKAKRPSIKVYAAQAQICRARFATMTSALTEGAAFEVAHAACLTVRAVKKLFRVWSAEHAPAGGNAADG